jgi:hypothetical protein
MENFSTRLAGQLDSVASDEMAGALGIPRETLRSALSMAAPAVLSALTAKAAQPEGAASLMRTFGTLTSMGSSKPATMLSGLLNDPSAMRAGMNMAQSLFGGQFGSAAAHLAGEAGLGDELAGRVLGMATPAIMGVVATQVKQRGVDAAGMAAFLAGDVSVSAPPPAAPEPPVAPADAEGGDAKPGITESLKRSLKKLFKMP